MIHFFAWFLLITAIVLSIWLDRRVDANRHQFIGRHIVLVIVIIGWLCFMVGVYLGPLIFSQGSSG